MIIEVSRSLPQGFVLRHPTLHDENAQSLTGATRLYQRAGMQVVQQYYIYEKELRSGRELSTQSIP